MQKGEIGYVPRIQWQAIFRKCPVCFGTRKVTVMPGSITAQCGYCKHDAHSMTIERWDFVPTIEEIRIDGVITEDGPKGTKVTYKYNDQGSLYNTIEATRVFGSRERASEELAALLEATKKQAAENEMVRLKEKVVSECGNMAHAGQYALDRIKDLEAEIITWKRFAAMEKS